MTRTKCTAWRSSGGRHITAEYARREAERQAKVVQRVQRRAQRLAEVGEENYGDMSRKRRFSEDEVTASSSALVPKGSRSEVRRLENDLQTAKQAAMVAEQHVEQLKGQLETGKRRLQRAKQATEDVKQELASLQARLEEVQGLHGLAMEAAMAQVVPLRDKNAQLQAQLEAQSVQLQAAKQAMRNAQLQKIEVTQQMVALQQGHLREIEQAARQAAQAAEVKMCEAGRRKAFHEAELQRIEVTLQEFDNGLFRTHGDVTWCICCLSLSIMKRKKERLLPPKLQGACTKEPRAASARHAPARKRVYPPELHRKLAYSTPAPTPHDGGHCPQERSITPNISGPLRVSIPRPLSRRGRFVATEPHLLHGVLLASGPNPVDAEHHDCAFTSAITGGPVDILSSVVATYSGGEGLGKAE
ncbi:hypothetical protein HaLaN_17996 [Haematococcus lacustris]|uniref:Uncharacterized protein n=1 Tax=Haematococcus lacustris TaxID=44745 RepID=A0A699ZF62_HAELA|nr:hypothetical protein HaLaN_17996 [Haematococcus lacustris]